MDDRGQTSLPPVYCRDCESSLLQPERVAGPVDGYTLVTRFCPDCERRDTVFAADDAVQAWLRREHRIASWMRECADELALRLADERLGRTPEGGLR